MNPHISARGYLGALRMLRVLPVVERKMSERVAAHLIKGSLEYRFHIKGCLECNSHIQGNLSSPNWHPPLYSR